MRWLVSALLIGAAVLKLFEFVNQPATVATNPLAQYILPIQIYVELTVGLLLFIRAYWQILRRCVIVLFVGFASYSMYLALTGVHSCNCFGPLRVNPWWTFGLDCTVVLGLLLPGIVGLRGSQKAIEWNKGQVGTRNLFWRYVIATSLATAAILSVILIRHAFQRTAVARGFLYSVANMVVLEPETWIGQRLPIAEYIDVDISHGEWIVLVHRHDCEACQEMVPKYEQRAALGEKIALVEAPPYGKFKNREGSCSYGRLNEDHEWFIQTPVELRLYNGIVSAAKTHVD
jgi:hypothetical protein